MHLLLPRGFAGQNVLLPDRQILQEPCQGRLSDFIGWHMPWMRFDNVRKVEVDSGNCQNHSNLSHTLRVCPPIRPELQCGHRR